MIVYRSRAFLSIAALLAIVMQTESAPAAAAEVTDLRTTRHSGVSHPTENLTRSTNGRHAFHLPLADRVFFSRTKSAHESMDLLVCDVDQRDIT
jgi:hypothetical protein